MPCLVFGWGLAQTLTPTCRSFPGLVINRFFLGLFEAGCLPLGGIGDFPPRTTTLLNIPFGATQYVIIVAVALFATKIRYKSAALVAVIVPVLVGLTVLYVVPRDGSHTGGLVAGYYLLAFIFGGNALIVAWILANTGGQTKKAVVMGLYNAASAVGNVVGPLVFGDETGVYRFGLRVTLGVFAAMAVVVGGLVGELVMLNRRRRRGGEVAVDRSMEGAVGEVGVGGGDGLEDATDGENEAFVYVY